MSPADFYSIIKTLPVGQSGFPTKKVIAEATKLNIYTVKIMLGGLVQNGKLKMEGNWYKFNDTELEESLKRLQNDLQQKNVDAYINGKKIDEILTKNNGEFTLTNKQANDYIEGINKENISTDDEYSVKMPKRFLPKIESFTILRWAMLVLGLCASIASAYYAQIWQHETLNIFWSWFLSLIMIGFSSSAFLTLIGLLSHSIKSKISTWLLSGIFFILWIVCLIYSVQVTVAGRFSQYQEIVSDNAVMSNTIGINKIKVNNVLQSIDSLKADKTNNQKQLEVLLTQYEYVQLGMGAKGETFQSIQNKIILVQKTLNDISAKIDKKSLEYEQLLINSPIEENKFSFYDWAAKIYKTDKSNIEWIFILFPSLFLDIVSPIALAVFMFLGRKKDE